MAEQNQSEDGLGEMPLAELLQTLKATPQGLTSVEAKRRPREHGPNSLVRGSRLAKLRSLPRLFVDPLIGILLVASGISVLLGDAVSGSIIIAMVLLSLLLNLFMDLQARHAVEQIRKLVAYTAAVVRDGKVQRLSISEI